MRPLSEFPRHEAARITTLFTDIDDTLTTDGRLPAAAYAALERLADSGIEVVPVTGRPAGWCDMIARFWPVAGVIGENGAFYFAFDRRARRMRRVHHATEAERAAARAGLERIRARVLAEVPGALVSADQPFRAHDLAIDFSEDVPPLEPAAVARIVAIFEEEGATARVSSIHVNGWFGSWDKLTMSRRFAAEVLGRDLDAERERMLFCGDSPNDVPMFRFFPHACGVANLRDFAGRLEAEPSWIAAARGAAGFVEIAEHLLAARRG